MSFKILLSIIYFSLYVTKGCCSFMGDEASLRQNIADLLDGKLEISDKLPFEKDELSDTTVKDKSEYDFIVIGAGSAGSTVASRLSENSDVTVLLIEAGGKEYSILDIPATSIPIQFSNELNWNYAAESSDKYCLDQKDRRCKIPRGKLMGGCSSHNLMLAMRGTRRDYDEWAKETGDDSWSYKNMLKYFKKLENLSSKSQSKGGPVHINVPDSSLDTSRLLAEAAEEMGLSKYEYDAPDQAGFTFAHTTIFQGERWSANRAYLRPAKQRKNLILTQKSHVHKILIDKKSKKAYGVRFSKNGKIYEVYTKKEVVLSAGAVNSPQILMLSGIGPKEHLRELKIDVIKDAPVGQNLIDHVSYTNPPTFHINDPTILHMPNILDPKDTTIKNYINDKTGILSYGISRNGLILFNSDDHKNRLEPNLELVVSLSSTLAVTKAALTAPPNNAVSIRPVLMRPRSRGKILLQSSNPTDPPKIHMNYFEDPDDVRVMIEGIKMAMKIGESNAFKKHGSQFQKVSSSCDTHGIGSDEYYKCELGINSGTMHHVVGTCKMGRKGSSSAVVNSKLKVIGVNGLRVADGSVMTNIVTAHTNIPVIAIAEHASDIIKKEYGLHN